MSDTVIVTVSGDRGDEAVEADRQAPLGALVGSWAARCSSLPAARLAVVADGGEALDPASTLADLRACYGTTLRLVPAADSEGCGDLGPLEPTEPGAPGEPPSARLAPSGASDSNGNLGLDGWRSQAPAWAHAVPAGPVEVAEGPGVEAAGQQLGALRGGEDRAPEMAVQVGGLARLARAARAALSRKALPAAEAYAVAERPGPVVRWRRSMAETDHLALLERRVRRAVIGESVLIAVVSPKGGVGKTTLTGLLGSLLAELRRDPVLAVDANADFGNLAARLCEPDARGATLCDLWAWAQGRSVTPAALSQRLGQGPHGLRVAGTPAEAGAMLAAADHALYAGALDWLRSFGGVILADCGTGLLDPPTRAALEAADQVVLVTDSAADTARLVVEAGRPLPAGRPCWLVANKVPPRGARVDLGAVRSALPGLAGSVVLPAVDLAENVLTPRFRWESAPRVWRAPLRELAASLSAGWGGR